MRHGWEAANAELGWYQREVSAGNIWLVIDLWSVDDATGEWAYSVSNRKTERFTNKGGADRAQAAVDMMVASELRSAARICANKVSS